MITRQESTLRIAGPVNLDTMGAMLGEARQLMTADITVLDVGDVTEVDSSLIALLLDLTRSARAAGRSLVISRPTAGLASLAGLYGVDTLLLAPV
jgi:phospholipid transport system transporter-binding protein